MTEQQFSHSRITSWRSCPKKHDYSYNQQLVPRRTERPLFFGDWVHQCLEAHYKGEGWRTAHERMVGKYRKLLPEEQFRLDKGASKKHSEDPADFEPTPSQVERLMRSYIWYYDKNRHTRRNERTIAVEVEFEIRVAGQKFVGIIDRIYEDLDLGIIVIQDHKIWGEIPDPAEFHTIDPQLSIYFHGAREALNVEADAIEFNYVRSTPPSFPEKTAKTGAVSRAAVSTDYPTAYRWLKENGFDPAAYTDILEPLLRASPFLRRVRLARSEVVVTRIMADTERSIQEILGSTHSVRNITRGCSWCPFVTLCRAELFGLDTKVMRQQNFMTRAERDEMRAKREPVAVGG